MKNTLWFILLLFFFQENWEDRCKHKTRYDIMLGVLVLLLLGLILFISYAFIKYVL